MKNLVFISFLIILYSKVISQGSRGEELIKVTGKVYDSKTMEPVPYAYIFNLTSNRVAIANDYCEFSFLINKSDTLRFTAVGYKNKLICLKDSVAKNIFYLIVKLKPKAYLLDEVKIYANDSLVGFRRDTTHIKTIPIYMGKGDYTSMALAASARTLPSGYITDFANLFNQHYKQEKN